MVFSRLSYTGSGLTHEAGLLPDVAVLADDGDVRQNLPTHVSDPGRGGGVVQVHTQHEGLGLLAHLRGVLDVGDSAHVIWL